MGNTLSAIRVALSSGVTRSPKQRGPRPDAGGSLAYVPALDGLRALAVIAVLLYHGAVNWLPGGFLGVEVFFVISGYLITSLLLAEWGRQGSIDLKRFWLRRARRLLPAVFATVTVVLGLAALTLPEEVAGLREDALAAFAYVTNWYLIVDNQSYFEAVGRPSPLRHLWSLAVEEQFYILWPLGFGLMLSRWGRRATMFATLAGAVLSITLMGLLFDPESDPSRLYYGTDTRAAGLLLGAALAFVWAPGRTPARCERLPFDLLGAVALALLGWLALTVSEFTPFLYRGGFAVVALGTATVIAVAVHPRARLVGAALGWLPLRLIGTRSYGLYLWHWPVFSFSRPQIDLPFAGPGLLIAQLAFTAILAEASYRLVESPIRHGAFGRNWTSLRQARGPRRRQLAVQWLSASAAVLLCSVTLGVSVASAQPPAPPRYLAVGEIDTFGTPWVPATAPTVPTAEPTPPATVATSITPSPTPSATPRPTQTPTPMAATATTPTATPTMPAAVATPTAPAPVPGPAPEPVSAFGDSVMIGAADDLAHVLGGVRMDAAIGRQVGAAIEALRARESAGQLGEVVLLHLGNNGTFTARQFDEVMRIVGPERTAVFVNLKLPRAWEIGNNAVIADGVARHANAALVDWHTVGNTQFDLFWDDGIHLRPEGAKVYAALVAGALAGR